MLEFRLWSFKNIRFGAFQIARALWSSAVRISFSGRSSFSLILRGSAHSRRPWIMIRYAGCFGIMMDFFKQPQASVQIWSILSLNFLGSFDLIGRFCLLLSLCIILTWNPIDYLESPVLLVVHQKLCCIAVLLCVYKITRFFQLFKSECSPNTDNCFCAELWFCDASAISVLTWAGRIWYDGCVGSVFRPICFFSAFFASLPKNRCQKLSGSPIAPGRFLW